MDKLVYDSKLGYVVVDGKKRTSVLSTKKVKPVKKKLGVPGKIAAVAITLCFAVGSFIITILVIKGVI